MIVGKSIPTAAPANCFGFVPSYDTKSKQRLQSVLQSQGEQDHPLLTFLSDGSETVRNLPGSLPPQSVPLLDWSHLATRVTVLGQYLKGLIRLNQEVGAIVQQKRASVKWLVWHGQVDNALDRLGDLDRRTDHFADTYPRFSQLKKTVQKFHTYIVNNRDFIPD